MGYTYRSPGPKDILLAKESEAMKSVRLQYLRAISEYREQGFTPVFIDESYVNQNHHNSMCWLKHGSQVVNIIESAFTATMKYYSIYFHLAIHVH